MDDKIAPKELEDKFGGYIPMPVIKMFMGAPNDWPVEKIRWLIDLFLEMRDWTISDQWKPIESHDGGTDECLIAIVQDGQVYVADRGWWEPGATREEWDEIEEGIKVKLWEDQEEGRWTSNHCVIDEPTHWMPLNSSTARAPAGDNPVGGE